MTRILIAIIALMASVGAAEKTADWELSIDYGKEILKRGAFLEAFKRSDYPLSATYMWRLLETGGLLGLRDYLIVLGKAKPEVKEKIIDLPLNFGDQGSRSNGKQHPRFTLSSILQLWKLKKDGRYDENKKYSYFEMAHLLEQTLPDWVRDPDALEGDYDVIGSGRTLFWYSPRASEKTRDAEAAQKAVKH